MRYANVVIKAVSLIALAILFVLFLRYAVGFGENGSVSDLAKSNMLIVVMILILITSAIASLAFDFYERSKQQNEQIFSALSQKIISLSKVEDKVNQIMAEYAQKMESLHDDLEHKVAENTSKFEDYMTQFANLSVQVFAKDKKMQNMQHEEVKENPPEFSGDYFNHYTEEDSNNTNLSEEPEVLSLANKVGVVNDEGELVVKPTSDENEDFEIVENLSLPEDVAPQNLIDDILNGDHNKPVNSEQTAEDQLSTIFNDELADTLAGLEIMKDDNAPEPDEIDLETYFSNEGKIKL